jgi:hypothetical protein
MAMYIMKNKEELLGNSIDPSCFSASISNSSQLSKYSRGNTKSPIRGRPINQLKLVEEDPVEYNNDQVSQ